MKTTNAQQQTADETAALVAAQVITPIELIRDVIITAKSEGSEAMVNAIKELAQLQREFEDREAERAFNRALAEFQMRVPPIPRKSTAKVTPKSGANQWSYKYADYQTIASIVDPILHSLGLTYTFSKTPSTDRHVCQTVTLRHVMGHSITSEFDAPIDSANPIGDDKKTAAANSLCKRNALVQVLGLSTCDDDTDGMSLEPIGSEQIAMLEADIVELGINRDRFLGHLGAESMETILLSRWPEARTLIAARRQLLNVTGKGGA